MNNYWEDKDMSDELKKAHNDAVEGMGVPEWAIVDCPFCKEELQPRAIRSISMMFNARNIGDIAVEFCCDKCKKMDTMYFRKAAPDMDTFVDLITPMDADSERYDSPKTEPLTEEKMYALQYNNLVEIIHSHKEK